MHLKTTTKDVAEAFGISNASVTRLATAPDSPAVRVGGVWRWPPVDQVRAWLERRTDRHRGLLVDRDQHDGR
jgi:hypothetical protein